MATYREIRGYVESTYGFLPHTCWFAEVKELSHIPHLRAAPNRLVKERDNHNRCPKAKKINFRRTIRCNLKKRLSIMHDNPRFKQIPLHTFRHYFATEKLRHTKMLTHVQYLLGHKSMVNIERYTHLVNYD